MNVTAQTLVLIDNSLSVSKVNREISKLTLKYLFTHTPEKRAYCFMPFSHDFEYIQNYTSDYVALEDMADRLEYENKETSITDVLTKVLDEWERSDFACRDIVIITDGLEEESINYEKEELYYLLEHNSYPVYVICLDQENNKEVVKNLSAICRLSRGKLLHTEFEGSDAEVEKTLSEQLLKEMNAYAETNWAVYEDEVPEINNNISNENENGEEKETEKNIEGTIGNEITEVIKVDNPLINGYSDNSDEAGVLYEISNDEIIGSPVSYAVTGVIVFTVLVGIFLIACVIIRHKRKLAREDEEYKRLIRRKMNEGQSLEGSFEDIPGMSCARRQFNQNKGEDDVGQTVALVNRVNHEAPDTETRLLFADLPSGEITFEDANDPSKYFKIPAGNRIVLGRLNSHCDIAFEYDDSVSSKHCEIYVRDNDWFVKDLESSNGTWVNGEKVYTEKKLLSGDLLQLGSLILIVRFLND